MKNIKKHLFEDILAGFSVSFAALSLGAAFGVMSGRGAFSGMIGAAIIPIITSLLGGTRIQASGPTAPMTTVTAFLVATAYDNFNGDKHLADEYITLVLLLSSLFIVLTGIFNLGKFIKLVPQVVVLGFMNGIGILIWVDQLKKIFGVDNAITIKGNILSNITIVVATTSLIYLIPFILSKLNVPTRVRKFIPSIFISILLVTIITTVLKLDAQHVELGAGYNSFLDYWNIILYDLPLDKKLFNFELISKAMPISLQLCLLAYLDSLLTSLVIDKMTNEKTKPNKELIAQGIANGVSGLLQGIPGAQATIRSVLLIKEGAKTRIAGVYVGIFSLIGFIVLGKFIALITSAVFIGVLLKAGLDVIDKDFINAYFKNKWYKNNQRNLQLFIITITSLITIVLDLNIAVLAGTILFYLLHKLIRLKDAEDTFAQISEQEEETISG